MKSLLPLLLLATPALAAEPDGGTRLDLSATASVARVPDLLTIGAGVVTTASRANEALAANSRQMAAVIAALAHAGVAGRDIQTSQLSLQPQFRYGENQPPVLTGYQATNRVTVRLRDLGRAGSVLDALAAAGANQIDGPDFSVEHPEAALDEARTAALATARARAELYARAAGLHVVRLVRVTEGEAGPPVVRPMMLMARAKEATPVAAGEQTLAITLQTEFELR